jgi:hypothetical protein
MPSPIASCLSSRAERGKARRPGKRTRGPISESITPAQVLDTSSGESKLQDYRVRQGGREWSALHTGSVLMQADEDPVIGEKSDRLPYDVAFWPST